MYSISKNKHPTISLMGKTVKIIRNSVHTFLQHLKYFTTIASFIILPFSISVLITQALIPRSFAVFPTVYHRLAAVFKATGFPPSPNLLSLLSLKLSQTITSSIITLPFTLSSLLLAKASIIHFLTNIKSYNNIKPCSFITLYHPIVSTYLCNSFIIFATNATCFSLLFLAFNFLEGFLDKSPGSVLVFSSLSAVFYSIILANTIVVCNLALVSSGIEQVGGFFSIVKAYVLIRNKTSTALALAVPINLGLAAVEALFHLRIIASSSFEASSASLVALEGVLIAYIYSFILILEVIMNCMFYQSCKDEYVANDHDTCMKEIEEHYYCDYKVENIKGLQGFMQI